MFVLFGPIFMWTAAIGCIIHAVLGVESMKWTVYTGQPIQLAYMKLGKAVAWAWSLMLFIPVIWPGWAAISATFISATCLGRPPGPGDAWFVASCGVALLIAALLILHIGAKIQRTLELINWVVVPMMVILVAIGAVALTPAKAWADVTAGLFTPGLPLGKGVDWFVVAAAVAYIPAGFGFNLILSSYARDKGWGMGSKVGYIPAVIGGRKVKLSAEEVSFTIDEENLKRWKGWLRVLRVDGWIVMSLITFITVIIICSMTQGLVLKGLKPTGPAIVFTMGRFLSEAFGPAGWWILLLGSFWILFGTQFGLMDGISRVVMDNFWISSGRLRRWAKEDPRKVYYSVVYLIFIIALILMIGAIGYGWVSPYWLAATGAILGLFALVAAYILQIVVNYRFMPKALRPHPVTTFFLAVGAVFYIFFLLAVALQALAGIRL